MNIINPITIIDINTEKTSPLEELLVIFLWFKTEKVVGIREIIIKKNRFFGWIDNIQSNFWIDNKIDTDINKLLISWKGLRIKESKTIGKQDKKKKSCKDVLRRIDSIRIKKIEE